MQRWGKSCGLERVASGGRGYQVSSIRYQVRGGLNRMNLLVIPHSLFLYQKVVRRIQAAFGQGGWGVISWCRIGSICLAHFHTQIRRTADHTFTLAFTSTRRNVDTSTPLHFMNTRTPEHPNTRTPEHNNLTMPVIFAVL